MCQFSKLQKSGERRVTKAERGGRVIVTLALTPDAKANYRIAQARFGPTSNLRARLHVWQIA